MNNENVMPPEKWGYIWVLLIFFFAFSYVAFMPEGFLTALLMSIFVAAVATMWLALTHLLWFTGGILYKIIALIIGGLVAVLVVIVIQFVYENVSLKM
ncbi:hypothetical protein [Methanolobus bombayensis]|uniref:hypothetical protein n=1 Tax=Methanolobus bombayensis TaxID=38023 RepID=UPI001AE66BCD|nr:hypothetical protein [Methanolobus bombayensis]MBP1909679.1 signal transduction histidine kinase [Methanolobus bombayensis]